VSFTFFGLTDAISGNLFVNVGDAISGLLSIAFDSANLGVFGTVLVGGIMSIISILIFPIHWLLIYRPDDAGMAFALMIPWVLCIGISALLFAKSAKQGFMIGVWLAAGYIVWGLIIYILLAVALADSIGTGIIDSIFGGLTDLHPLLAIFFASAEGGLIGGAFGALFGAIKYKPGQEEDYEMEPKKGKRSRKGKKEKKGKSDEAFSKPFDGESMKKCPHCGANLKKDQDYCLECNNFLG